MISTFILYSIATDKVFQSRVLVLAVKHAQGLMNQKANPKDETLSRLQAKAVDLLNTPDTFKDRLAWSVVVLLPDEAFSEKSPVSSTEIDDQDLEIVLPDAFDAIAGVTPTT